MFKVACLIFTVAVVSASNDNLISVVQIFRHGQRTPARFAPSDPYRDIDTYWGGLDLGHLTNEGKRQHYALGQFSRKRYSGWLPEAYNSGDIYVQTTDVDRTHMSAQANLNGLYPAKGRAVWRRNTNWQPIPVHPASPKVVFLTTGCPLYTSLLAKAVSNETFTNLANLYASMFDYISKNTNSNITNVSEAYYIYDALLIEEQAGYPLPPWTKNIYPEPIRTLSLTLFEQFVFDTQMKKLFVGVLLNDIIGRFERMIADPTSSQKYQMISAHDTNVYAILSSTGNTPTELLPFTVSLWFELRTINFINVVQLWMKNGDTLTQLSIKGCELNCPLTKVKTLLSDLLLDVEGFDALCASTV